MLLMNILELFRTNTAEITPASRARALSRAENKARRAKNNIVLAETAELVKQDREKALRSINQTLETLLKNFDANVKDATAQNERNITESVDIGVYGRTAELPYPELNAKKTYLTATITAQDVRNLSGFKAFNVLRRSGYRIVTKERTRATHYGGSSTYLDIIISW